MLAQADEIKMAYQKGVLSMSNLVIEDALRQRYSTRFSACDTTSLCIKYALFLYLFALDTWCPGCDDNFLEETDLKSVLYNIENLSASCCSFVSA